MVTSKLWNFDAIHYPFHRKTALRVISGETDEEDAVEYSGLYGNIKNVCLAGLEPLKKNANGMTRLVVPITK